ncbi:MAG: hypothetical protein GY727_04810, partial [Gammaproteobacteria bacterium]|nr:hypothetical protein [Gammaproteobacteria bacterium]
DGRASFYSSGSAKAFANAAISAGNNVNVTNVGGVMTVAAGPATAFMTSVVSGTGSAVAQANAKIDANNITVTSAGSLNISRGGATAQISSFRSGSYSATASANASLIATQAVNLNVIGDINLNGTVSNIASASVNSNDTGNYTVVANSNILVKGGTDVTITTTNGGLSIAGGSASVSSVPTAAAGAHTVVSQASATAEISATQNVTINLAGTGKNLTLTGGNGDASINSYVCNNCSATADASV